MSFSGLGDKSKIDIRKLVQLFTTFFRIGCFTFGGGFAMIPLIEREVVTKKKWIGKEDIVDVFAISQSIPGAVAVNSSAFVGYRIYGAVGAVFAVAGVVLPSFIIITLIAVFLSEFQDNLVVQKAFLGVRSAVIGLIIYAAIKIGKVAIVDRLAAIITVVTIVLLTLVHVHPVITIIGGGLTGASIYYFCPEKTRQITRKEDDNIDLP